MMPLNRWREIILGETFLCLPGSMYTVADEISNISTAHSNIGYLFTLVLNLSVLLPLQGNSFSNNLALCLTNSCRFSSLTHLS
jgi:hypothetical protein